MMPLEDLNDETFNKILKEAREFAGNDESKVEKLLVEKIVKDFVNYTIEKSMKQCLIRKQESMHEKKMAKFDDPLLNKPKNNRVITKKNVKVPYAIQVHNKRCENENFEVVTRSSKEQKKSKKLLDFAQLGLDPPPDMPKEVDDRIKEMGGIEVTLVMQKQIFSTDLNSHHDRLLLPSGQVSEKFLKEEEKVKLDQREWIQVRLLDPSLDESIQFLKRWNIGKTPPLILSSGWKDVVKNNTNVLKVNAIVQLWSFRCNSKPCFALVKVRDGEEDI